MAVVFKLAPFFFVSIVLCHWQIAWDLKIDQNTFRWAKLGVRIITVIIFEKVFDENTSTLPLSTPYHCILHNIVCDTCSSALPPETLRLGPHNISLFAHDWNLSQLFFLKSQLTSLAHLVHDRNIYPSLEVVGAVVFLDGMIAQYWTENIAFSSIAWPVHQPWQEWAS